MTKRDIVIRTLNHQESDVIPYFLEMTEETEKKMIAYIGDEKFFEHTDSYLAQERNESFTDLSDGKFQDMFGVIWDKGAQEGDFGIAIGHPIPDAEIGDYKFPEPDEKLIREKCERLVAQKDKFTMYIIGFSLYERLWTLHGIEQTLEDFLLEPEFIDEVLDGIVEYNCKVVDIVAQYPIDCIFYGDDWGQQQGLIMANANWKPFDLDDGTPTWMGGGFEYDVNEKGDKMVYACGDRNAPYAFCMPKGGYFFDNIDHFDEPFDMDMDEEDMTPREDFAEDFQVATDEEARYWEKESHKLYTETDYAIMGVLGGAGLGDSAWVPGPTVKHPKGIRSFLDWLMATAAFPDYIEEVFALQTEVMLKNLEIYKQAVGDRIQVVWISGTDFGTQNGLFLSVPTFRKLFKPYYKKINDWVHQNTNWKTFYHTCGCVNDLLDDLADMGVDCLNPVQFSAMEPKGMSPQRLKAEYGDRFTFWGGGVDTQRVLPFGTPEAVREQVAERVRILNQGGGFIFNTIHNVVANVPPENLIAMYETVLGEKIR